MVCQHYQLKKLLFRGGKTRDFSSSVAVIIPTSLWTASVLVQGQDGLFAPVAAASLAELGDVKEIQYTLTAWDADNCVQEHFRHPVKHKMLLGSAGLSRKGAVKLFMQMALNDILDVKHFRGVKGLQFIC